MHLGSSRLLRSDLLSLGNGTTIPIFPKKDGCVIVRVTTPQTEENGETRDTETAEDSGSASGQEL